MKLLIIYTWLFFVVSPAITFAQLSDGELLQSAKDSIYTNPNYTNKIIYKLLEKSELEDTIKFSVYSLKAGYSNLMGEIDSAIFYSKKILNEIGDRKGLDDFKVSGYHNLATAYSFQGVTNEAIKEYIAGLEIAKLNKMETEISHFKFGLAMAYFVSERYNESFELFNELKDSNEPQISLASSINIGLIHIKQKDYKKAINTLDASMKIATEQNKVVDQITIKHNYGTIAYEREEYSKAIKYFNEVIEESEKHGFERMSLRSMVMLAKILVEVEKDYDRGEDLLLKTLELTKSNSELSLEKEIHELLEKIYLKRRQFEKAHTSLKLFYGIKDSLQNITQEKEIKGIEAKYKDSEQKRKIAEQESTIEKAEMKQNSILIISVVVLIFLVALIIVYSRKLKFERELKNLEVIQATRNEQERIASQLHDNICGNISAAILRLENEDIKPNHIVVALLKRTFEIARKLSHELFSNNLPSQRINNLIEEYQGLENLQIVISITNKDLFNQLPNDLVVLVLNITQEMTANCLKHAKAKELIIQVTAQKDHISLFFEDDGIGFNVEESNEGIGLQNIKKRITTFMGEFVLDSSPGNGLVCTIKIPFITQKTTSKKDMSAI